MLFGIIGTRLGIKLLLSHDFINNDSSSKQNALVYGAGDAGRQLLLALENTEYFVVIGFLDDDAQLHGQIVLGQVVFSPSKLEKLINRKSVSFVFFAL